MNGIHTDMNGAIGHLMDEQKKVDGTVIVDVITFDDKIDVVNENAKPEDVSREVIVPRGSTALNDAIGFAITRLGRKLSILPEQKRPGNVIVVVVTDGMENASREYTAERVKAMVEEQESQWNWTFMYLAANVDAFATGKGYGFRPGQTISFDANGQSVADVYSVAGSNILRTAKGDRRGFTDEERQTVSGS